MKKSKLYQSWFSLFGKYPKVKYECISSSIDYIQKNLSTRIFNEFHNDIPCLLSNVELNYFSMKMFDILHDMTIESNDDEVIMDEKDKKKIIALEKKLIAFALRELLDVNKEIKPEIIALLHWQDHKKEIDSGDLICSYIGMVNLAIFENLENQLSNYGASYIATCSYLNANYKNWMNEVFIALGYEKKTNHSLSMAI